MTKIKLSEALTIIRSLRNVALERALGPDATIEDVARAALIVRKVTTFWLQYADPADRHDIEAVEEEFLQAMSIRLMEVDESDDLAATAMAARVVRPAK